MTVKNIILQKFTWPIHEKIVNNNYTVRIRHACKFEQTANFNVPHTYLIFVMSRINLLLMVIHFTRY